MKVPLAKVALGINQLAMDTGIVINNDNSVSLSYKSQLYEINPLDSLFHVNVEPFEKKVTIDQLQLEDLKIEQFYTMEQMVTDAGLDGVLSDGSELPAFLLGGLTSFSPNSIPIDITDYLQEAVLEEGFMDLVIENKLPLDITNLDFSIVNSSDESVIFSKNIDFVAAGDSYNDLNFDLAASLAGNEIEGAIYVVPSNLEVGVPGATFTIPIDYEDYVFFGITIRDLKVETATAIFPPQVVADQTEEAVLEIEDGVEMKSAIMRSGKVQVTVKSTVQTEMYLHYEIPSATLNGEVYAFDKMIPAAPEGQSISGTEDFPINGYLFDCTGLSGNEVNTFYSTAQIRIQSTNEPVTLTKRDTVFVEISVADLKIGYVSGFMGEQSFSIGPETEKLEVADPLLENIDFEQVGLKIIVENNLGILGEFVLNQLSVEHTFEKVKIDAEVSSDILEIKAATDDNVYVTETEILNGAEVFNAHPNQVSFDIDFNLNPEGNLPLYSNFAHYDRGVKVDFEFDIPLKVKTTDLEFRDTVDIRNAFSVELGGVKDGVLTMVAKNTFPIQSELVLYFADDEGLIIDSLVSSEKIKAGEINEKGIVEVAEQTILDYTIGEGRLQKMLNASFIYIEAKLTTQPDKNHVTLFQDYVLDLRMVGDFDYTVKSKL